MAETPRDQPSLHLVRVFVEGRCGSARRRCGGWWMNPANVVGAGDVAGPSRSQMIVDTSPSPCDPRHPADQGQRPEERQPAGERAHGVEARRDPAVARDHVHRLHAGLVRQLRVDRPHVDGGQVDRLDDAVGVGRRRPAPSTPGTAGRRRRRGPGSGRLVRAGDQAPQPRARRRTRGSPRASPGANSARPGLIDGDPEVQHRPRRPASAGGAIADPDQDRIEQLQRQAGVGQEVDEPAARRPAGEVERPRTRRRPASPRSPSRSTTPGPGASPGPPCRRSRRRWSWISRSARLAETVGAGHAGSSGATRRPSPAGDRGAGRGLAGPAAIAAGTGRARPPGRSPP